MFQAPKGTKDWLPDEAERWQIVLDTVRKAFEKYGFRPLETPAFEPFELLAAKGGIGEAVKEEIYYFKDKGGRELGLRFDLTVPLARVLANNSNLPKPFKRYQIGKVWRYDNPQAGRFREFWQADVDTVGSSDMLSDAECVTAVCEALEQLGFKEIKVRLNNRKLLQALFVKAGVKEPQLLEAFRSVDKLDKIGTDGVKKELDGKGIAWKGIEEIIKLKGDALEKIEDKYGKIDGLNELKEFLKCAKALGIDKYLEIDLSLVRGLEYYTGPVFEVMLGDAKLSCGGGGRYDKLIAVLGGPDMPATGMSIGLNRVVGLMEERGMFRADGTKKVFVASVNDFVRADAAKICQKLRKDGVMAETDLARRKLSKQMEYAAALNFSHVIVVGPKELEKKCIKLRDMRTGKEKDVPIDKVSREIL
ncbi:MAG: histidine--tRNA ligase [Candidatus Aenigmatarchaeota archaeon]